MSVDDQLILHSPVVVDAIRLEHDLSVINETIDFSRLPYFDGTREVNPDLAFISENIVAAPFGEGTLDLPAGVHLHWSLPKALTRSLADDAAPGAAEDGQATDARPATAVAGIEFPAVPTLWLVTREHDGARKAWLVESDFLHPPDPPEAAPDRWPVAFPVRPAGASNAAPWRRLGRALPVPPKIMDGSSGLDVTAIAAWIESVGSEPRLKKLTAIGYGDLAFASFYPNCRSVFGFHDPDPPQVGGQVSYRVVGWYRNAEDDLARQQAFRDRVRATTRTTFERAFSWTLSEADFERLFQACTNEEALSLVCHGLVHLKAGAQAPDPAEQGVTAQTRVAVGNTASEALSALLADAGLDGIEATRREVEDGIESLHLLGAMQGREVDIRAKFKQARHAKGFRKHQGGTVWTVRPLGDHAQSGDKGPQGRADSSATRHAVSLPEPVAVLLNKLNLAQEAHDRLAFELESLRERLFADWYKYMVCAYPPDDQRYDYPDVDLVCRFIERTSLEQIARQTDALRTRKAECETGVAAIEAMLSADWAAADKDGPPHFKLFRTNAARFFEANEPVLLIEGPCAAASERFDDRAPASVIALRGRSAEIAVAISAGGDAPAALPERPAMTSRPWNPFMLEWEIELEPTGRALSNLDAVERAFDPGFIAHYYHLPEKASDLAYRTNRQTRGLTLYSGRSLLASHAPTSLQTAIDDYLEQRLLEDYLAAHPTIKRTPNLYQDNAAAIRSWYQGLDESAKSPFVSAALSIEASLKSRQPMLSQALSGFNAALTGHKQTYQLKLDDPLGFDAYRAFTSKVAEAVGPYNRIAPQPLNDFNPIRSGTLRLSRLRLVDSFGRSLDLTAVLERTLPTDAMLAPSGRNRINLPPRLVPPARLQLRWLANGHILGRRDHGDDDAESNSHPATTPICGWLVPNMLDGSILIYDHAGRMLAVIEPDLSIAPAPGASSPLADAACARWKALVEARSLPEAPGLNLHLDRVVRWIIDPTKPSDGRLAHFLAALESGIENINPASFAAHEDLALLMGRPLAIVRASLDLQARGLAPINHDWNVFRRELISLERSNDRLVDVRFPVRLGEHRELDDGLVGYWREGADGTFEKEGDHALFIAPQAQASRSPLIATYGNGDAERLDLQLTLAGAPSKVTMLFDPRASLHATSGILPTKQIDIPPDLYKPALGRIEVTFRTMPVLSPRGALVQPAGADRAPPPLPPVPLPLPAEPGYRWSWITRRSGKAADDDPWAADVPIVRPQPLAHFDGPQELREGWLRLVPEPPRASTRTKPDEEA